MHVRHFLRMPFGLALLLVATGGVGAAAQASPVVQGGNAPGMKEVIHGFFDDKTGDKIGRLRIESVGVEYQKRGFLRVAWDPIVVLDGVTLEIAPGATWPEAGVKILDALHVTGRSGACVLRRVTLRLDGPAPRDIRAATASLRADGGLELTDATSLTAAGAGSAPEAGSKNFCFWLAGPQAGQLVATVPVGANIAQTLSTKQTSAHSASP